MLVEVLGTGGSGKTTLEPLLAERLGIPHYAGGKRQELDGTSLSPAKAWARRTLAVVREPGVFVRAALGVPASTRRRIWFGMDLCRREANSRTARKRGGGVLASGPMHALGQGSARFGTDLSDLASRIRHADVYVLLQIDPQIAAQRLAGRREVPIERVGDHVTWSQVYEKTVEQGVAKTGKPTLKVDATSEPAEIADILRGQIETLFA